ncbi:hypothetical protein SORBI_3005G067700 [Sorghum bicolor]|uniref:Uncharacterized protein n=1 Tax=Sorghum bicolor TaxID=4558 RepID=A0A1B6PQK2_SORBI|nr:hypothetical protein SORBI_3005G067700 [Sorghum bicolor]
MEKSIECHEQVDHVLSFFAGEQHNLALSVSSSRKFSDPWCFHSGACVMLQPHRRHNRSSELSVVEPLQRLAIHAVCVLLRSESCRAYAGHHPS